MLLVLSLDSHMKTPTSSLIKSGLLHPTFSSSSLISCAFALAQPFDDKQSSLHHRTSFWFCTFVFSLVVLAFLSRPSAHRQLRPRQLRYRLKTVLPPSRASRTTFAFCFSTLSLMRSRSCGAAASSLQELLSDSPARSLQPRLPTPFALAFH